jgi:peroxiredoxin
MNAERGGLRAACRGGAAEVQSGRHRRCAPAPLRRGEFVPWNLFLLFLFWTPIAGAATQTDSMQALGLVSPNEAVAAPEFSLPDLAGKKVQLKTLRGSLVFLNFFATWCEPCREEMPGMERLFRTHQDKGLVVLAVNMEENAKTVRPFVQQLKLSFPIVLDTEGAVTRDYGVRALPVSFLIGRDGHIRWRAIGGRDWESAQARKLFAQLVAEKK